jgi:hypothetical protein
VSFGKRFLNNHLIVYHLEISATIENQAMSTPRYTAEAADRFREVALHWQSMLPFYLYIPLPNSQISEYGHLPQVLTDGVGA